MSLSSLLHLDNRVIFLSERNTHERGKKRSGESCIRNYNFPARWMVAAWNLLQIYRAILWHILNCHLCVQKSWWGKSFLALQNVRAVELFPLKVPRVENAPHFKLETCWRWHHSTQRINYISHTIFQPPQVSQFSQPLLSFSFWSNNHQRHRKAWKKEKR